MPKLPFLLQSSLTALGGLSVCQQILWANSSGIQEESLQSTWEGKNVGSALKMVRIM